MAGTLLLCIDCTTQRLSWSGRTAKLLPMWPRGTPDWCGATKQGPWLQAKVSRSLYSTAVHVCSVCVRSRLDVCDFSHQGQHSLRTVIQSSAITPVTSLSTIRAKPLTHWCMQALLSVLPQQTTTLHKKTLRRKISMTQPASSAEPPPRHPHTRYTRAPLLPQWAAAASGLLSRHAHSRGPLRPRRHALTIFFNGCWV